MDIRKCSHLSIHIIFDVYCALQRGDMQDYSGRLDQITFSLHAPSNETLRKHAVFQLQQSPDNPFLLQQIHDCTSTHPSSFLVEEEFLVKEAVYMLFGTPGNVFQVDDQGRFKVCKEEPKW